MSRITLLEMLLRAGLINENQFDEALQNRVVHGGRIGTSLIELGFVSEVDLARFLSKKLSVPYVAPEYLKNIAPETIAVLPKALALKYQAIPLRLEKKKLALAMSDPSDLKAVDEISFATGLVIRPVIAPEVRLMEALALYYGAEVPSRYLQIARRLESERELVALTAPEPEEIEAANDGMPAEGAVPVQAENAPEAGTAAAQECASGNSLPPERETLQLEVENEDDLTMAEIIDDDWVGQVVKYSIDEISQKLSWACDRDEIAQILLEYLGSRFERSALFTLRAGAAYGWKAAYGEKEIPHFHKFRLPLDSPSVLKTIAEEGNPHLGPIPDTVSNSLLCEALGGESTDSALLVPIIVTGTIVGIVYAAQRGADLDAEYLELKKVLFKAGLAFEILICREKIQMMTGS